MLFRAIGILVAALSVGACVSPVKPIQPWAPSTAAAASIATVTVINRSSNATEENLQILKTTMEQQMPACAKGATKYEMQLLVDNYKMGNAGAAMLIGDRHELAAEIKIVDPATNAVAAQYYVQETRGGGGLIGIAIMSSGAAGLSRDFSVSVCKRVFNV